MKTRGLIALSAQFLFVFGLSAQDVSNGKGRPNIAPPRSNNAGYISRYYINPAYNISPEYINGNLPNTPGYNPNYPYIPTNVPILINKNSPRYYTYPGLLNNDPGIAPPLDHTYIPQKVSTSIEDTIWLPPVKKALKDNKENPIKFNAPGK